MSKLFNFGGILLNSDTVTFEKAKKYEKTLTKKAYFERIGEKIEKKKEEIKEAIIKDQEKDEDEKPKKKKKKDEENI